MTDPDAQSLASKLEQSLREALEVMEERQRLQDVVHERAAASRTRFAEYVDEVKEGRSPFSSWEEASASNDAAMPDLLPTPLATLSELHGRWNAALSAAEALTTELTAHQETGATAQQIAECLRSAREITLRGAAPVDPRIQAQTREFLMQEQQWTQERLRTVQSLPPDVNEETAAPYIREGLARSVGFFENMAVMLEVRAEAGRTWERERAAPLQEALSLASSLPGRR